MIVLHDKKIIAKDTPQNLFNNPKLPIVASFFGEFNVIENHGLVYAHQLKIVKKSSLKAKVKQSYFNGNSWLIETEYKSNSLFIEHKSQLKKDSTIHFEIIK